ncbi:MAG: RHS repeat-associated core domain-containing protein [Terriglobales bacterium]
MRVLCAKVGFHRRVPLCDSSGRTKDANSVRIEKSSGTLYWPGPSGSLAETTLTGTINEEYIYFNGARIARVDRPSGTVHYYFSDHLGSASVITDALGNITRQDFYFPYGGELPTTTGSDSNHYKFTGKERDSESGLDSFGKRYYASTMGRWMSPDLVNVTEDRVVNPANTLNKYVYGGNNPLKYIDPDGQDITYFYDQGGAAGHAILFAYDPVNGGDWAIESFGPANHLPIDKGVSMFEMKDFTSVDNLRQNLTSLTIQTSPEITQEVIAYMKANPDPALWILPGPNCTTEVWKILQKFKLALKASPLDSNPQTPRNLWLTLIHQYNPSQQGVTPKNGQDYGNPRCGGNSCMFNLMWLMLPQSQPTATVTVTVTNCVTDSNGKKTCDTQ